MTKKVRILISLVLVAVAFIAGIAVYAQTNRDRSAQADGSGTTRYTVDDDYKIAPPAMDPAYAKGTEQNPFFVLELVPYEEMGHFGYQISGCEPVDMMKVAFDDAKQIPPLNDLYEYEPGGHIEYRWKSEGLPYYFPADTQTQNFDQYGVMKYVGDGTGNYNRMTDPAPIYEYKLMPEGYTGTKTRYKKNADDTYSPNATGEYLRYIVSAEYEEATGGDYLWTPLSANDCQKLTEDQKNEYKDAYHDPDENGEFKACLTNKECYVVYGVKDLKHKNYFLKESIGLAYEIKNGVRVDYVPEAGEPTLEERIANYKCVVYTVTPEDLNVMKDNVLLNKELIEKADLMSISSVAATDYADAYDYFKEYDATGLMRVLNRRTNGSGSETSFADNPLDWPAALAIYQRASATTNPLPIIWDTRAISQISTDKKTVTLKCDAPAGATYGDLTLTGIDGYQGNLFKLYLMLYEMSAPTFRSLFGDPSDFDTVEYSKTYAVDGGVTRYYTTPLMPGYEGEGNRYWSFYTFFPWKSGALLNPNTPLSASNREILDSLGIMSLANNALFHYASGGAQNLVRNGIHVYDGGNFLKTAFASAPSGVANDQYGREVYEFFEGIGVPKTSVTTAEVLYYLLNGLEDGPGAINNHNYKILELQPATSYKGGGMDRIVTDDPFWKPFIANYANTYGTVTVERMSTSEFIGKQVECVSEYDLIYIGVNTLADNWTMDFAHDNNAADNTNYIYAHTGPMIRNNRPTLSGWLDENKDDATAITEGYYVLSGNDLTKNAKSKLIEFVENGAPVLFGTGFYTNENATSIVDTVDRNSNVYDFAKESITTPIYEYALSKSSTRVATENALRDGLAVSRRVEFADVTLPKLYDEKKSNSEKYLSGNTLSFRFKVDAPAGTTYRLVLYIDINGDGVFSDNEMITGVTTRKNGYGSDTGMLVEAGSSYVVTKPVTDRKGSVFWKLDMVHTDSYYASPTPLKDRTVLASLSGLSAIKAAEKEQLRILQIVIPDNTFGGNLVELPQNGETFVTDTEFKNNDTDAVRKKKVTAKFWELTRDINGLELSFERKTQTELVASITAEPDYLLDNYQMVILGFGDRYNGVSDDLLINAIAAFGDAGRAVLYTHDASSLLGDPNDGIIENWGKKITLAFRDRYGMDRYDVSDLCGSMTAVENGLRSDFPVVPTKSEGAKNDLMAKGGYALAQGLSNGILYRWGKLEQNLVSEKVTKVNSGAVTQYPYKIGYENAEGDWVDDIPVAMTHPQYYQLDMENENLTVWYCLANSNSCQSSRDRNNITKYFNASSNDVRNNYYIYNYGNITYSGMGHSGRLTEEEVKLFINTFVAAYRAAGQPVQAIVTNDDATRDTTTKEYYLTVEVDSTDSDALLGGADMGVYDSYRLQEADGSGYKEKDTAVTAVSKRVEFRIGDDGGTAGASSYALKFYLQDAEGNPTVLTDLAVYRKADGAFMDLKTDDKQFKAEVSDIYYVDVPVRLETVNGKTAVTNTQLKIDIEKTYMDSGVPRRVPGSTTVNIVPRGLFDLD